MLLGPFSMIPRWAIYIQRWREWSCVISERRSGLFVRSGLLVGSGLFVRNTSRPFRFAPPRGAVAKRHC